MKHFGNKKLNCLWKLSYQFSSGKQSHARIATGTCLRPVVVVGAARTPIGSFQGSLKDVSAPKLGGIALKSALDRSLLTPNDVEECFFGNVLQAGIGQAPARQVVFGAGCPESTEATTVNKVCASGMKSVMLATQAIASGYRNVMAAGGMESMSQSPFLMPRFQDAPYGGVNIKDHLQNDSLIDVYTGWHMGHCGEKCAKELKISKEEQDEYARLSYSRTKTAYESGIFDSELTHVPVPTKRKPDAVFKTDEEYVKMDIDAMSQLPTLFDKNNGTITAANSSKLADGAAALILMAEQTAKDREIKPLARIVGFSDAALASVDWPVAPVKAQQHLLDKHGLKIEDISLFEINEAFSVVVLANAKLLGLDLNRVNIDGGAVSIGHPFGMSGARIVTHLVHRLEEGQFGMAGICNGGGAASAILLQRL